MRIPAELEGARLNMSRTAELIRMDTGHFRKLIQRGVFPEAKTTAKGMPYFDYDLLCQIGEVLKSGVGLNNEEIAFYRRRPKHGRRQPLRSRRSEARSSDSYLDSLIEACRQVGVGDDLLTTAKVKAALNAEFGNDRPALEQAIPVVARRLFAGE